MRRFLKNVLLYSLPLLAVFVVAEIYLRTIDTAYTEKEKKLYASDPEILILGNSHAAYGIDPNRFSMRAFNAANVAQSLYFDKRIALKHLGQLPHLNSY